MTMNMSRANARQRKRYETRKARLLPDIQRLKATGLSDGKVAEQLGVHHQFVTRVLKETTHE